MFKYQKGSTDIDVLVGIMIVSLVIVAWFAMRTLTVLSELNDALTNSGIICKPIKVNGKWYCAERITIIKSNDSTEQYSAKEIGK